MKRFLFFAVVLAVLLSACGGSPSSDTTDVPAESVPADNPEPPASAPSEDPEPPETAEPDLTFEFDILQRGFISISENTTIDDILSFVEENSLFYSEEEIAVDKKVHFIIAYEEGVMRPRYADSGDYLDISFDRSNGDTILHAQYVNAASYGFSALFYNYGTWYNFRDQNAADYSGYYNVNGSAFDAGGIVVKYSNGNEVQTNYYPCNSPEEAIENILEGLVDKDA